MRPNVEKKRSLLPSPATVVATVVLATLASAFAAFSQPATLHIDGTKVATDVPPVTSIKGEAFVPLRVVAESLGALVDYDAKTNTIELVRGKDELKMRPGERSASLDGKPVSFKHAPFTVRGRTMVSLNTIAKAFGEKTHYDRRKAKIDVMTPGIVEAGAQSDDF